MTFKLKTFQANEMESLSGNQSSFTEKSCSVRVAKMGLSTILKYVGKGAGDEKTLSEAGYLGRKRLPVTR